jgi:hypothetical protein
MHDSYAYLGRIPNVLNIIEKMTWVMERTPCAFIKMPEEVFRDQYLGLLLGRAVLQQHGALGSDP